MNVRQVLVIAVVALVAGYAIGVADGELPFGKSDIASAEKMIGLEFSEAERDSLQSDLADYLEGYGTMRATPIPNSVAPALVVHLAAAPPAEGAKAVWSKPRKVRRPKNLEDVAFWSVGDLAELLRTRQVTSMELTAMYLERLKQYGPELECVISLTEQRAMEAARKADAEIANGRYRGPLHGMPYGAKDLLAVRGTKTTWGAEPYKDQMIDETATVIRKLDEAGAVLVAKTTLGALAWGEVWYGGMTRNPWNTEEGSSGSSAGSASATAAGLVPFAIGTETWGSIVSPSTVCGTTGLRPTFGRVSRAGAMALSWSMDKIGPICRSVEDCAIVFDAIRGEDGIDASVVDGPFSYRPDVNLKGVRIGYVKELFDADYPNKERDAATLARLRELGATLEEVHLPERDFSPLACILTAEAAAAFDELTRSNRDDLLVRQIKNAWPNTFRAARFIPAVEYIQANRIRTELMQAMEAMPVDVYLTPTFGGGNLLLTNLTGQPCVVLPNGFDEDGEPTSITFMGRLYGDATVLAVARAYQQATDFHSQHPARFQ
jgi:Asp-tRNA(Asn)/Glu-tRNA(Gln) amidotransferase A subunit family amidase